MAADVATIARFASHDGRDEVIIYRRAGNTGYTTERRKSELEECRQSG